MTVTYTAQVATSGTISSFLLLLARWRGSIYKLVWLHLVVFLALYISFTLSYRFLMNNRAQRVFEGIVHFCHTHGTLIPLSFVLGFYVSIVMTRWWAQYTTIPWPDSLAILVSANIQGYDERARAIRRTIMRYICLCQVIVFTMISPRVKKRFPTYNQIIEAGLLLESEKDIIEKLDTAFPHYPKHWMPIVWAASIVTRARREGKIRDDYAVKSMIDELNNFRGMCGFLLYYDWVSVPLVYTQVVTLATYAYFLCSIIGQQWTMDPESRKANNIFDQYFPILTTLQFFFYMGWLKVAESLINPFGDDDDDFELNWMIDRNLTVSYIIVDEMHQDHPELVKDQYWDEVFPNELPYTIESQRTGPPEPSTAKLDYTKSAADVKGYKVMLPHLTSITNQNRDGKHFIKYIQSSASICDTSSQINLRSSSSLFEISLRKLDVKTSQTTSTDKLTDQECEMLKKSKKQELREEHEANEIRGSSSSANFEDLIAERNRERRERLRNRFLSLRNTPRTDRAQMGGFKVTMLRESTPESSLSSIEEEQEEPSISKKDEKDE